MIVQGSTLSDAGMPALRDLPDLESLNISTDLPGYAERRFGVTDAGLAALGELPLTQLSLHGRCMITDSGLEAVRGKPLTDLDLSGCVEVTDKGIDVLSDIQPPETLKRLNISGLRNVSPGMVKALKMHFVGSKLITKLVRFRD